MRAARTARRRQAGMTLIEILIAVAILALMMTLAWKTTRNTFDAKTHYEAIEDRNHELRVAMARVVSDIEAAYLSGNEDPNATDRRTLFVGKSGGVVPELRFSSLGHTPLWADANESEQTLISYSALSDRKDSGKTNWVRRESRRLSNKSWKQEPADTDILVHDVEKVTFDYWNWEKQEWQDHWDSTASDAERNHLPIRVRITVTFRNARDEEVKLTTQARIRLQEPLLFFTN
ncbi:MAG: prepilin-type N-terminal cleavage/methylation domain-containing protein [Deltaproteobacteria bacterium]|nr:prepilin-type N-terminal cleavage/methylation domain-containing protein [Deltaproteobacteria bacterium]